MRISIIYLTKQQKNINVINCHLCEECASCDTVICYNCHTSNYDNNIELYDRDYFDRWNSKNDDYICEIYRTISKYIRAYDVLRHDVR